MRTAKLYVAMLAVFAWGFLSQAAHAVKINEFRSNAVGGILGQQYIELWGDPGESLDGLSLLIVGTTGLPPLLPNHGVVLDVISLNGHSLGSDSKFFVVGDAGVLSGVLDLEHALNIPIAQGRTVLLVKNFSGSLNMDLDANNDGVVDAPPWIQIVDGVAMSDLLGTKLYSSAVVGGGLLDVASHVYRDPDGNPSLWLSDPNALLNTLLDSPGLANLNLAPTAINLSQLHIPENMPLDALVGLVSVVDPDSGQTHVLSLLDSAGGIFGLEGNELKVLDNTLLDYETSPTLAIQLLATDSGNGFLSHVQVVQLIVDNVNEAPLGLDVATFSIDENSPAGSLIGTLVPLDVDFGDALTLNLLPGNGTAAGIDLLGNQLKVGPGLQLDFETSPTLPIGIQIGDGGGLLTDVPVVITVNDVNDLPIVDLNGPALGVNHGTSFTAGGGAVTIADDAASITDQDNLTLTSMTVQLASAPDGTAESLSATAQGGVTIAPYDATARQLRITGEASLLVYQSILRSVVYANTSESPNGMPRQLTVVASDGSDASAPATSTINIGLMPEIEVRRDGSVIQSGGATVDFGAVAQNAQAPLATFVIRNLGGANLLITGVIPPAGYALHAAPDEVIAPGEQTTLAVRLSTTHVNVFNGSLVISTNDIDENPFVIELRGEISKTGRSGARDGWTGYE